MTIDVGVYSAAAELPTAVQELLRRAGRQDLFCSARWFDLLLRDAWDGGRPQIFAAGEPDRVDTACVLFTAADDRNRHLRGLSNFYTMRYRPILEAEAAMPALEAILDSIAGARPAWSGIELRHLAADAPSTALLETGLQRRGWAARTYHQFENWYEPTAGISGADYFAARPSQLRNTITRRWRRATREHRVKTVIYTGPEGLETGIAAYERIYARSWKSAERYPSFIGNLMRCCAGEGSLRLGVVTIDDVPAAAQIWLVSGGRATIYKLAYDERFAALSIGSALTKHMFDHVLDIDQVTEVDYGTGSEPYKRDWMSRKRDIVGLLAHNKSALRGFIGASRDYLARSVKRLLARPAS